LLNRINNFVVAYTPPYSTESYFPSIGEISVTVGFVAILVLAYRFIVLNFPVISPHGKQMAQATKYTIKGVER
jgi:Ni/Fe-hydrogenase subunit HybB-like protein